jgi:Flp pilus assembly protein TadD
MMRRVVTILILIAVYLLTACSPALDTEQLITQNRQMLRARVDDYRRLGRPLQALFLVEMLADQQGWSADLYGLAGELRRDLDDLTGAAAAWESIDDLSVELLRQLAEVQIALGRWASASVTLSRLAAMSPEDTWARLQYGLLLSVTQPNEAQTQLVAAAAAEPAYAPLATRVLQTLTVYADDPLLPMRLGVTLAEREQWQYAEIAFAYAAQAFDPYAEALAYLGMVRDRQDKDGSAQILRAVALEPQNARVRYLQGLHLRLRGNSQAAIDALAQAVALEPENPAYYAELAQVYVEAGDIGRAERLLQVAVDVSGNDVRYRQLLALFYADEAASLTNNGLSVLEGLVAELPDDADVAAGYGWTLHVSGDSAQALTVIDEVLRTNPDHPRATYFKARILLDQGSEAEARVLLLRIVSGDSDFAARARILLDHVGS